MGLQHSLIPINFPCTVKKKRVTVANPLRVSSVSWGGSSWKAPEFLSSDPIGAGANSQTTTGRQHGWDWMALRHRARETRPLCKVWPRHSSRFTLCRPMYDIRQSGRPTDKDGEAMAGRGPGLSEGCLRGVNHTSVEPASDCPTFPATSAVRGSLLTPGAQTRTQQTLRTR